MDTIVNSAASTTKDTSIDAPHLNLNLNLNPRILTFIVGGIIIITLSYRIEAVLQPQKVKEEDGLTPTQLS